MNRRVWISGVPLKGEREPPAGRVDQGAEGAQLRGDGLHRAPAQRIVAVETGPNAGPGAGAEQHPDGRSGVRAIEGGPGVGEPAAGDHGVGAADFDACAERRQCVTRGANVAAGVEVADSRRLGAAGGRNQSPVRDGLVAGNVGAAAQRARIKADHLGHFRLISDKESIIIS